MPAAGFLSLLWVPLLPPVRTPTEDLSSPCTREVGVGLERRIWRCSRYSISFLKEVVTTYMASTAEGVALAIEDLTKI